MRGNLRYVIVDEYQDINPAQERLITLLAGTDAELCVVGDDDQAIYQWRGSDVANIVSFTRRRQKVKAIELLENRHSGNIPSYDAAIAVAQASFYAPFANAPSRERMLASVALLLGNYTEQYADDLKRIWATERPFELHTKDGLLTGRADIILDEEDGAPGRLAIVDYKVAKIDQLTDRYDRQLLVYTHAGRREGWDVRGAYLHALHNGTREPVDTSEVLIAAEVEWASQTLAAIRRKEFIQKPEAGRCAACDFVTICRYRPAGVVPEGDDT